MDGRTSTTRIPIRRGTPLLQWGSRDRVSHLGVPDDDRVVALHHRRCHVGRNRNVLHPFGGLERTEIEQLGLVDVAGGGQSLFDTSTTFV
jgi:hypothetical protein